MAHCQTMLREQLESSVNAYVEMPREKWVGEYSCQPALTTSQIWWTAQTNQAFERLEQGMESALKDYAAQVVAGLNDMTAMVLGELHQGRPHEDQDDDRSRSTRATCCRT